MLFEDETVLREFPPLRACWAKRGERAVVPITGKNAKRTVFGVLNPWTGSRLFRTRRRGRSDDFCAFLSDVRAHWKRWDIFLVLDRASSHTAKKSKREAERLRITFGYLPTACPELNPDELLWAEGKTNVSANRVYETVDEQADAFVDHLAALSNRDALRLSGATSPNFWLRA